MPIRKIADVKMRAPQSIEITSCSAYERKRILGEIKQWRSNGEGVMSWWWIFVIAIWVFAYALEPSWERRKDRQRHLDRLNEDIRLSKFWNWDAESKEKERADLIAEHKNWRNNIKFGWRNWIALIIGAALFLIALAVWFEEDPAHVWGRLLDLVGYAFLFGLVFYWAYRLKERMDIAANEIIWLHHMLKEVKDHAENMSNVVSASVVKLRDRLDKLEGKST
jgi:hypothetical protein